MHKPLQLQLTLHCYTLHSASWALPGNFQRLLHMLQAFSNHKQSHAATWVWCWVLYADSNFDLAMQHLWFWSLKDQGLVGDGPNTVQCSCLEAKCAKQFHVWQLSIVLLVYRAKPSVFHSFSLSKNVRFRSGVFSCLCHRLKCPSNVGIVDEALISQMILHLNLRGIPYTLPKNWHKTLPNTELKD